MTTRLLLTVLFIGIFASNAQKSPGKKPTSPNPASTRNITATSCIGVLDLHGNDCVRLPLSQAYYPATGFTWETWFYSNWYNNSDNSFRLGQSLIMTEDGIDCEDIQLGFGWSEIPRNAIGFVVDGPGVCASHDFNPCYYRPPGGFQANTWYHVAGVRNYSTNQTLLYFNGQLVDTKVNTRAPLTRDILTRIGTYIVAADSGFKGKMDEIRMWNRPRTAAEILANYNKCLTGTEPGLVTYYRSNEMSGSVLTNSASGGSLPGEVDPSVGWNNTMNAPLTSNCIAPITNTVNASICQGQSLAGHSTSGTYVETFPSAYGCDSVRTLNLVVTPLAVNVGPDTTYCTASPTITHTLHAPLGSSYSWTPAAVLNNSNAQNPVATISSSTTFRLTLTDAQGCIGSDDITVNIAPQLIVKSIEDSSICPSVQIQLQTTGAVTYSWTPVNAVSSPNISNPIFIGTASQPVYVSGTATNGCIAKDTVNITIKAAPLVKTIVDSTICAGTTISLVTTGAQTYSWTPSPGLSNTSSPNPTFSAVPGTYALYVTGTAANNCTGKDTVNVTVRQLPVFNIPPNKEMCENSSVSLDGNNGNNVDYLWSPGTDLSNNNTSNPVATPASTISYNLKVTDRQCMTSRDFTIIVTVNDLPVVDATKSNDISCTQPTAQLTATGAGSYSWSPAASLNNALIANPVASPTTNTTYLVIGRDGNGCENSDTVTVTSSAQSGGYYLPNSFTPNGDGKNDCFGIKSWGDLQSVVFIVYNRWGNKVFETHNIGDCWNGNYHGQPADAANYVYYIKGKNACGEILRQGNVLLIR
ncbi:MAG: hypothetical protein JWQ27_149 [Ferruginibacter sp.]|nr:hypothetical protein [Ferruginibacter sp.]